MRHQRIVETVRRTRKTLYVVAGLYVGIGFLLAVPSALAGDRLSAFLGFLIISGALGLAFALSVALRLSIRMSAIGECLEDVRRRLERYERSLQGEGVGPAQHAESASRRMDLTAIGKGDPSVLAAATLDRARFPRLVTTMDKAPPEESAGSQDGNPPQDVGETGDSRRAVPRDGEVECTQTVGVADKNSLRVWKVALRSGDLPTCREVLAGLLDTAAPDLVAELTEQLDQLTGRTERSLRAAFSGRLRDGDYVGALSVGEEIRRLLPDRRMAREFERVRPYLQRRVSQEQSSDASPLLVAR